MSENTQQQQSGAVQTTGHAWDGDLQEFNNPLPRWWVWTFYATVIFSLVYWVIFPTWPYANTYTKGIGNTITFKNDQGEEVTTHWNTRALLIEDMQNGEEALKQKAYLEKVNAASYEEILSDPDMMAFTESTAKVLFADNCAACHGADLRGGANGEPSCFLCHGQNRLSELTRRHAAHHGTRRHILYHHGIGPDDRARGV